MTLAPRTILKPPAIDCRTAAYHLVQPGLHHGLVLTGVYYGQTSGDASLAQTSHADSTPGTLYTTLEFPFSRSVKDGDHVFDNDTVATCLCLSAGQSLDDSRSRLVARNDLRRTANPWTTGLSGNLFSDRTQAAAVHAGMSPRHYRRIRCATGMQIENFLSDFCWRLLRQFADGTHQCMHRCDYFCWGNQILWLQLKVVR